MRLFALNKFYEPYLSDFDRRFPEATELNYGDRLRRLLDDRNTAALILAPVLNYDPTAAFMVANDKWLLRRWREEKSLQTGNWREIIAGQIEEHKADVVYVHSANAVDSTFLRRLPGCVKVRACYLSAPLGRHTSLRDYDVCLSSHRPYVDDWRRQGLVSGLLMPSHDPECREYAENNNRPVDIAFVGSYSPAHHRRNLLLDVLVRLSARYRVEIRLMCPRWRAIEARFLRRFPIPLWNTLPKKLRDVADSPVFGRDLYSLFGRSKIVFNAAIDMSGQYRSNMRIFESLGCGCCMIADEGIYPDHLTPGKDFITYQNPSGLERAIEEILDQPELCRDLGRRGAAAVEKHYSKNAQWQEFYRHLERFL